MPPHRGSWSTGTRSQSFTPESDSESRRPMPRRARPRSRALRGHRTGRSSWFRRPQRSAAFCPCIETRPFDKHGALRGSCRRVQMGPQLPFVVRFHSMAFGFLLMRFFVIQSDRSRILHRLCGFHEPVDQYCRCRKRQPKYRFLQPVAAQPDRKRRGHPQAQAIEAVHQFAQRDPPHAIANPCEEAKRPILDMEEMRQPPNRKGSKDDSQCVHRVGAASRPGFAGFGRQCSFIGLVVISPVDRSRQSRR